MIPLLIGIGLAIYPPVSAKGDVEVETNIIPNAVPTTKIALQELATETAIKHGLNVKRFLKVQECEIKKFQVGTTTVWDYKAQSDIVYRGVRENSWGAWQIHLPSHPTITKEQAQDIYFATEWSAEQWENGNASAWSCYRNNF